MKIGITRKNQVIEMKKESLIDYSFKIGDKIIGWASRKTTFETGPYYCVTLTRYEGYHICRNLKDCKEYILISEKNSLFE